MLDDGRGKARAAVFRHVHEKETGRTSTIGVEVMGLDEAGRALRPNETSRLRHFQAVRHGGKRVVTFVDLAGHERYLKTTISGLTGLLPDYALVVVGLNMGVSKMTREHLGLAAALGIPPIVVCTKVDIAPPDVAKHTLESVAKVLRAARKLPYTVRGEKDVATAAGSIAVGRVAPVVVVSSVSGEGMDLLRAAPWPRTRACALPRRAAQCPPLCSHPARRSSRRPATVAAGSAPAPSPASSAFPRTSRATSAARGEKAAPLAMSTPRARASSARRTKDAWKRSVTSTKLGMPWLESAPTSAAAYSACTSGHTRSALSSATRCASSASENKARVTPPAGAEVGPGPLTHSCQCMGAT